MVAKLQKQLADETDEKAYCDEQMTKTEARQHLRVCRCTWGFLSHSV